MPKKKNYFNKNQRKRTSEEKNLSRAKIKEDGSLGTPQKATLEELEKALKTIKPEGQIMAMLIEITKAATT